MDNEPTTLAVERYLLALEEGTAHDELVRDLLGRAVERLRRACGGLLHGHYPRLARPPLNLEVDELLSGVVERLLKALRVVRPTNARAFFALASQHIRWELNELARHLDGMSVPGSLPDGLAAPAADDSAIRTRSRRLLAAIEQLPEDEREVLELVQIQGLTHAETAALLQVATKTIQRRLNRALLFLAARLEEPAPLLPEEPGR